jgi:predicted DNA-binding mobile mystery protein A
MTTIQLAKRCGLSKQRILRIEQDEILGRTTLATLEKVAQQLECKLVYAFFPQKDLLQMIEDQAEQKALEKLVGISHSMKLENQKIAETIQKEQLELLKEKLIRENIKSLWQ